jgi:FAD/FMN-containing dehydrogenase
VEGGMVIDLTLFREIKVDPEAKTVDFGGGCIWREVDEANAAHGLAMVGGTVSHTGVGGLTLGGGMGFLSGKFGLVIDSLLEVEIVTADGEVRIASERENADLFWAVRGAGAAFGAVTRFKVKLRPQGEIWAGPVIFPAPRLPEIITALNKWWETANKPEAGGKSVSGITLAFGPPPDHHPSVIVHIFWDGPEEEGRKVFAPIFDLGPIMVMTNMMPYHKINTLHDALLDHGARWQVGGMSFQMPLDTELIQSTAAKFYSYILEASKDPEKEDMRGSGVSLETFPMNVVNSVPLDAMAYCNRGNYYNGITLIKSKDPTRDAEVRQFKRDIIAAFMANTKTIEHPEKEGSGLYTNYDEDAELGLKGRNLPFGANTKRLIELKKKWDPQNRFNKPAWNLA